MKMISTTTFLLVLTQLANADNSDVPEVPDLPEDGISILPKMVGNKTRKQDPNGPDLSQTGYDRIMDSMQIAQKRCNLLFGVDVSNEQTLGEYYNRYLETLESLGWTHGKAGDEGYLNTEMGFSLKKEAIDATIAVCTSTLGPAATAMAAGLVMLKGLKEQAEKSEDGTVSLFTYKNLEQVNATFNMDVSGRDVGTGKFATESTTMGLYAFRVASKQTKHTSFLYKYDYASLDFMVKAINLECSNKQWNLKNGKDSENLTHLLKASKKETFQKYWDAYMSDE